MTYVKGSGAFHGESTRRTEPMLRMLSRKVVHHHSRGWSAALGKSARWKSGRCREEIGGKKGR